MSEFVLVNDIHLSDKPPASCTSTYQDDLFELLEQVSALAQSKDAAIVLAGDVFHHKTPIRTSHESTMRLIDWARQALVPVYAVPGNHDLSHDRLASLHETQPLGVVFASGAITMLEGWMDDHDGSPVYGVPWQMTFDDTNVSDALADYRKDRDVDPHQLVVTHAPLYPPGRELPYENYPASNWADAMGNTGTVHYGHVHEPHGCYRVNSVTFSNCGALSRGSLTESNLSRIPSVAIWDSTTGVISHHELRAKPASEVFRLAEAMEKRATGARLNTFLDAVQATQLDVTSTDSVVDHVRQVHADDPALIGVVVKLLEEVQ